MMNSAPTSGRNVMTESIGQLAMSVASAREHEPGDEQRGADHHGERVVVEVAGLQPHHVAGDVDDARRDAVRPEAVDQPAVAAAPQEAAEPDRRTPEQEVVDLVEVPLVEQEAVEDAVIAGEPLRNMEPAQVIPPDGDPGPDDHGNARQNLDRPADVMHLLEDVIARAELERLPEEHLDS